MHAVLRLPANYRLQRSGCRLGAHAGSPAGGRPVSGCHAGGHRSILGSNTGRRPLSRDPLGSPRSERTEWPS